MLLIAIGGLNLIFGGKRSSALIMLSIGAFFMLPEIFDIPLETRKLFWPLILVIIGIILLKSNHSKDFLKHRAEKKNTSSDIIDVVSIFGGSEQKVTSRQFAGGNITSIFGGSEIDLSDAEINDSQAIIEIFTAFGGTEIIVPPEWEVQINVTAILGGFSDERNKIVTDIPGVKRKVLIISGFTIFGGGTVTSY
jgi:predicted membrane protein